MKYVFPTDRTTRYRFPTHTNRLVMDRAEATASESFITVMEPGEAPPLHVHHDTEQVFFVLSGEGRLITGADEQDQGPIVPGDLVRIPPGTRSRASATRRCATWWSTSSRAAARAPSRPGSRTSASCARATAGTSTP